MILHERYTVSCKGECIHSVPKRGCLDPAPVPRQCSFARTNATSLCLAWRRCAALNCNVYRDDCQARVASDVLEPSFGDAHAYSRKPMEHLNINEKAYYRHRFNSDYFLSDALYVQRTFFARRRRGVFVESGAFDGSVYGSNSYFFERYMGWTGLLVEASQDNCKRLAHRRTEAPHRVQLACTALCSFNGWTSFSSANGGCCGKTGVGRERVSCARARDVFLRHNVSRVDFWSLDVEGGELDVLLGVDWNIPVHVMLIESVNATIRAFLQNRGFRQHHFVSLSNLNEIWVNKANAWRGV